MNMDIKSKANERQSIMINLHSFDKSAKHLTKIEDLLENINNDFKKRVLNFEKEHEEFSTNFITQLKQYSKLYTLCMYEICHELQTIGLDFFSRTLFKLFQSFKVHSACFLKYHIFFFQRNQSSGNEELQIQDLLSRKNKDLDETNVQDFVNYIKMTKVLTKSQIHEMTGDKYAKLEKAKFLLEQEGYELDKMLFDFKKGKDEIESFLKNSINYKNISSSGVNKILEKMLKHMRSEEFLFNYDGLIKTFDNNEYDRLLNSSNPKTNFIQEIAKKIIISVDSKHKIRQFNEKKILKVSEFKELELPSFSHDEFTQTDPRMFDKTKGRRQSIMIENMNKKNEASPEKQDFMQTIKDLEFEKKEFMKKLEEKEGKLLKRKEKIHNLRIVIEELRGKLTYFNDKDLQNINLLRMKEQQLLESKSRYFEKETQLLQKINENHDQIKEKDIKIKELVDEKSNLYLALEFNKTKEPLAQIDETYEFSSKFIENIPNNNHNISFNDFNPNPSLSSPKKSDSSNLSPRMKKRSTIFAENPRKTSEDTHENTMQRRQTQAISLNDISKISNVKKSSIYATLPVVASPEIRKNIVNTSKIMNNKTNNKNVIKTLKNLDEACEISKKKESGENPDEKSKNLIESFPTPRIIIEEKPNNNERILEEIEEKTISYRFPKDLELICKFSELRRLKKLKSLHVKHEISKFLKPPKKIMNEEDEIKMVNLKNENKILLECIKKKNIISLFSLQIFPKNKPFQKKLEFILENFQAHKTSSNYFEYIYSFFKTHQLPIQTQQKFVQTINFPSITISTQTDFKQNPQHPVFNKNEKEFSNLIKIIEKMKENGQDIDNTTATSIESKQERNLKDSSKLEKNQSQPDMRNFTSSEKFINNKRTIQLNSHLNSSQNSKYTYQSNKLPDKPLKIVESESNSFRANKTAEKLNFFKKNKNERNISVGTKNDDQMKEFMTEENQINNNLQMKEFKTEEDFEEIVKIGKIEEQITKDIFEHLKKMNKKDEKNYSKIKFFFRYPFRSIYSKYDNKKRGSLEEKKEEEESDDNEELTFNKFQLFFNRMVKIHKRCGVNCIHLRRFYQKIGFQMKIPVLKQEMILTRNIINSLPKIF